MHISLEVVTFFSLYSHRVTFSMIFASYLGVDEFCIQYCMYVHSDGSSFLCIGLSPSRGIGFGVHKLFVIDFSIFLCIWKYAKFFEQATVSFRILTAFRWAFSNVANILYTSDVSMITFSGLKPTASRGVLFYVT